MPEKLKFYVRHSLNDLRVNGQRTLFALLCIAAGVAAIVSLQQLGVMIEDSLTGSLQESNRGDMQISVGDGAEWRMNRGKEQGVIEETSGTFSAIFITPKGIDKIQAWFDERFPDQQVELTYRQAEMGISGLIISLPAKDAEKTFVVANLVEVDRYPLYGEVLSEDNQPLSAMIQEPTDIVLSRNLADDLDAEVGDKVRLNGASAEFTVRGIVPTGAESGFENFAGALMGYYYLDTAAVRYFSDVHVGAERVYVKLSDPSELAKVEQAFNAAFPYLSTTTTLDLQEQNSEISKYLNQLVIVMGLVSLLIGGIGIVNTMLVIVSRRTTEIAVLKTIGLEAEQVTMLFLVEALIMGFFGSLIGIVLGWGGTLLLKGVAGAFLTQSLNFRITPTPAITGLIVGMIVTAIFGFLPTLAAGQVRPNLVLRPTDTVVPKAGRARSFVALMVVLVSLSLVAQVLVRDLLDSDTLRTAARMVGVAIGALLGLVLVGGGLLAGWTRGKPGLRLLRWGLFLIGLPILGYLLGYYIPAVLILGATFIIVGILYVLLWTLIWSIGGGALSDLWLLKVSRRRPATASPTWLDRTFRWLSSTFRNTGWGKLVVPLVLIPLLPFVLVVWGLNLVLLIIMLPFWLLGQIIQRLAFIDFKLSLRTMVATKGRGASTLLALVIGVFTLSLITMLVDAITNRFEELLVNEVGGNVVVMAAGTGDTLDSINAKLTELQNEGIVRSYAAVATYNVRFVSLLDTETDKRFTSLNQFDRFASNEAEDAGPGAEFILSGVDAREVRANVPQTELYAGRHLNASDVGPWNPAERQYPPIVISVNQAMVDAGVSVGDRITFEFGDGEDFTGPLAAKEPQKVTFEIVGLMDRRGASLTVEFGSMNYAPLEAIQPLNLPPSFVSAVVDVQETEIPKMRRAILEIPMAFPVETRDLNDLIKRVISQFTSFPTLVAALALFTGGIVIANSVALATLERRREIAVMKAVGLQRERVLGMLLLEYGLMGLIGGLIGVGIGGLILYFMLSGLFQGELGNSIPYLTAAGLMGLCVAIALVAAIATAWRASGEKPLNVLRYE